jgi:hypothetical protein
MDETSEKRKRRLPEAGRPKRGTTVLPDGRQGVSDGGLSVLDKGGDVVSWVSSDLLAVLWGDEEK